MNTYTQKALFLDRLCLPFLMASLFTYGFTYWLIDDNYAFALMLILSAGFCISQKKFNFDINLFFMLQASIFCAMVDLFRDAYYEMEYAWLLPIAYILGKAAVGYDDVKQMDKRIECFCLALAFGMFFQGILDFTKGIYFTNPFNTERWNSFWANDINARTTFEVNFILMTALCSAVIFYFRKKYLLSIFIVLANIILEVMAVKTEGRENTFLLIVEIIFMSIIYFVDYGKDFSHKKKVIMAMMLGLLAAAILAIYLCFRANVAGIYDLYSGSYLADGGLFNNERIAVFFESLQLMVQYPLGGFHTTSLAEKHYGYFYTHNMLQEYARNYDFVIYVLYSIFMLLTFIDMLKLSFKKGKEYRIKYILVPMYLSCFIYYNLEPNGYATRNFWLFGLFLAGLIRGKLDNTKEKLTIKKIKALRICRFENE